MPPSPDTAAPDFTGAGEFKGTAGRTSGVVAGTGLGGAVTGDPTLTTVFTPLILPGLFTASVGQSALPADRVSFEYGYYNGVAVQGVGSSAPMLVKGTPPTPPMPIFDSSGILIGHTSGTPGTPTRVTQSADAVAGFNLNTFNISLEKTFLDGLASVYVSVPFLYAADNISGQNINGIGDVTAGFKVILYQNLRNGNTLTGGFTVSAPTGQPAVSTSFIQSDNGTGNTLLASSTTTVNPTFLQPWWAGLLVFDRLFFHEYFGVIIPTDSNVATFINSNSTIGYALFRSGDGRGITSVTPTVSVQALIPVNNRGPATGLLATTDVASINGSLPPPPPPSGFTFTDQVFVSGGVQLGVSQRWLFSSNVVVPVVSPRGYNVGATFGLNYFY